MSDKKRDFSRRSTEEQQAFLNQTWCNQCMEADLGMNNPLEYEQDGVVIIEGQCNRCGEPIVTELTDEDI